LAPLTLGDIMMGTFAMTHVSDVSGASREAPVTQRTDHDGDLPQRPRPRPAEKWIILAGLIAAALVVTWLLVDVLHVGFTPNFWYVVATAGLLGLFGAVFYGLRWALRRFRHVIERPRKLPEEDRRS
jgi:hypothetical protein